MNAIKGCFWDQLAMQCYWRWLDRALHYDLFPWVNHWVYWIKRPAASLSLAAATALACALFGRSAALVSLVALVVVVALGYAWPSLAIRGLAASIAFPRRRVAEGDKASVRIRIVNRWPWPVWGIEIQGGFGRDGSVALAHVPGRSTAEFEWEFIPECRGEYPNDAARLVTGFPFGLRFASRVAAVDGTLLVWPRIIPLETLLDAAETRPSDELLCERRIGDSGDMCGTRPFREGDSLRRVHWAQTARTGRMIVCERQAPLNSAIRVVFDSDPRWHRGIGTDSTLEWSIRIAASVCLAYHRENASVECCFGHEILPVLPGASGRQRFLDGLARWQPCVGVHGDHCAHEHTPAHCRRIHHRNCGVFQLTITTDLGVAHRTEHRHVHGDQRVIALKTASFAPTCDVCQEDHSTPSHRIVLLERSGAIGDEFARKWRSICHAG